MALTHVYYTTRITVAYTIEVPDGMDEGQMARDLLEDDAFYNEHIWPDLSDADWNSVDVEVDGMTDEIDFTAEQVNHYIGKED